MEGEAMIGIATHARKLSRHRSVLCGQVCARIDTLDWRQVNCLKCRRIIRKARLRQAEIDGLAKTVIDKMRSMHH